MFLKRSTTVKYFFATFVGAALHAEWFVYLAQHLYWQNHDCLPNDATCTKILFVGDPQIEGDTAYPAPLSYIINWDNDRYLRSTFSAVMKFFKPDVIVFLGDLMNEGAIATLQQFHGYIKRIKNIYDVDHQKILRIWVPGENDIGGEENNIFRGQIQEFQTAFPQPPVIRFRNLTFYEVNVITRTYPQKTDIDNTLKIVVSHYPVLPLQQFSLDVENILHPNIFFCAHEHDSKYMIQSSDRVQNDLSWFNSPRSVLDLAFNEGLQYEVYVPTCSYLRGTSYIGYGAAVVDNENHNLRYTVFWSSTRFPYLMLYLVIIIILILYCLIFWVARYRNRNIVTSVTADMSPLLKNQL